MKWAPFTELQFLKGVGPKYADLLRKKGLFTFQDFVEFYPRAYQDLSVNKKISELIEGETVSLKLKVVGVKKQRISKVRSLHTLVLTDGQDVLDAKFFKIPYRGYFNQFEAGSQVQVSGKVKLYRNQFEIAHPDLSFIKEEESKTQDFQKGILPVYSESEFLNQKKIKTLIDTLFKLLEEEFRNTPFKENSWLFPLVPPNIKEQYKLLDRWTAIKSLHFPDKDSSLEDYIQGRTRAHLTLIFEEFFVLELLAALRKKQFEKQTTEAFKNTSKSLEEFLKTLPFSLTKDQTQSLKDISEDFQKTSPMHRLLQGDVGSGKTLVAFASAFIAVQNGKQVALMAPTEILAEQHLQNAKKFLKPLGIKCALLTGKTKGKERELLEQEVFSGKTQLLIGTHALFEDRVKFNDLGLVIIDEQHRFGVHQRQRLKEKGSSPHFLVMTATPIPRTLTMTIYGDLDVSLIETMPPGRTPIKTQKFYPKERSKVLQKVEEELLKGHQAYFVFPLVSESEALDLKSAEHEFEELSKYFSQYKVSLLHGKMKPQEKEAIMESFRRNKSQVLISTTVVEVGVDVPNATVMVVENCERFGLSQLHQLRGRVGRGKHPGKCYLILGNKFSKESLKRAQVMEETTNGFVIAEEDLKLRGPGEVLGSKQSGLPEFKIANLLKHQKVLIEAKKAAFKWAQNPESAPHLDVIKKRYQNKLDIS